MEHYNAFLDCLGHIENENIELALIINANNANAQGLLWYRTV